MLAKGCHHWPEEVKKQRWPFRTGAGSRRGVWWQRGPPAVPRCHLPGLALSGMIHKESNSSYVWPAGIRPGELCRSLKNPSCKRPAGKNTKPRREVTLYMLGSVSSRSLVLPASVWASLPVIFCGCWWIPAPFNQTSQIYYSILALGKYMGNRRPGGVEEGVRPFYTLAVFVLREGMTSKTIGHILMYGPSQTPCTVPTGIWAPQRGSVAVVLPSVVAHECAKHLLPLDLLWALDLDCRYWSNSFWSHQVSPCGPEISAISLLNYDFCEEGNGLEQLLATSKCPPSLSRAAGTWQDKGLCWCPLWHPISARSLFSWKMLVLLPSLFPSFSLQLDGNDFF